MENTDITNLLKTSCINTPMWEPENSSGWTTLGKQGRLVVYLEHSGGNGGGNNMTVL